MQTKDIITHQDPPPPPFVARNLHHKAPYFKAPIPWNLCPNAGVPQSSRQGGGGVASLYQTKPEKVLLENLGIPIWTMITIISMGFHGIIVLQLAHAWLYCCLSFFCMWFFDGAPPPPSPPTNSEPWVTRATVFLGWD